MPPGKQKKSTLTSNRSSRLVRESTSSRWSFVAPQPGEVEVRHGVGLEAPAVVEQALDHLRREAGGRRTVARVQRAGDQVELRRPLVPAQDGRRVAHLVGVAVVERQHDRLGRQHRVAGPGVVDAAQGDRLVAVAREPVHLLGEEPGAHLDQRRAGRLGLDAVVHEDRHRLRVGDDVRARRQHAGLWTRRRRGGGVRRRGGRARGPRRGRRRDLAGGGFPAADVPHGRQREHGGGERRRPRRAAPPAVAGACGAAKGPAA